MNVCMQYKQSSKLALKWDLMDLCSYRSAFLLLVSALESIYLLHVQVVGDINRLVSPGALAIAHKLLGVEHAIALRGKTACNLGDAILNVSAKLKVLTKEETARGHVC